MSIVEKGMAVTLQRIQAQQSYKGVYKLFGKGFGEESLKSIQPKQMH